VIKDQLFDDAYKGKKVLITGTTGFKGSWLAIWMHELGADVYGLSLDDTTKEDNFESCGVHKLIKQHYCDIRDKDDLISLVKNIEPEVVFHLAAQPLVIESYLNPIDTISTNVLGTAHVLEAIKEVGTVKVAVMITSDKCYDNKEVVWGYRENDELGGKDIYSASKACAEILIRSYIMSFLEKTDTVVASVRAGNVIGGGDWSENRLLPDIYRARRAEEALVVRNPGATRPWQHVLEPLYGYMLLGSKMMGEEKDNFGGAWNFGPSSSKHYSVKNIVDELNSIGLGLKFEDASDKDSKYSAFKEANFLKLDVSKAVNYLGWHPVLNFEETMLLTHEGYVAQLNNEDIYQHRLQQLEWFTNKAVESL
jgi:CDP-glucose 4,6-dehydratase